MKTPETNNSKSSNVWEENPWNLPYDLDHVNKVRAISFPEQIPHSQKLAEIPQLFNLNGDKAINDNTGRTDFAPRTPRQIDTAPTQTEPAPQALSQQEEPGIDDTEPDYTKTWLSNDEPANNPEYYSRTWPIASPDSPLPTPETSKDDEKKKSRLKRFGRAAIRVSRLAGLATTGVALQSAYGYMKVKEGLWNSVDKSTPDLGNPGEAQIHQFATKRVEGAQADQKVIKKQLAKVRKSFWRFR